MTREHTVGELATNFDEIKNQTKRTAANAHKAYELSARALESAAKGQRAMNELLVAIEGIKTASDNISKIIKTIDDIAMQTNLLALNAAVEAAHAGNFGRGFMVVAEEVRSLAGKSKQAADQTKELILESMEKVKQGVITAKNSEEEIKSVISEVQNVNDVASEISKTAGDRLASVEKIEAMVLSLESRLEATANSGVAELCEAPKTSPPKPVFGKPEAAKTSPLKPVPPKPAFGKSEPMKTAMPKPTPQKPEPSKTLFPKPVTSQTALPKIAPPKPPIQKPEPPKTTQKKPPIQKPMPIKPQQNQVSIKPNTDSSAPEKKPFTPRQTPAPVSNRRIDVPSGAHEYDRKDFGKY